MKRTILVLLAALAAVPVASARPLRFLYWNFQDGMWDGQADNYARFVDWMKAQDPDVCVWCEGESHLETGTGRRLKDGPMYLPGHIAELAARYGHAYSACVCLRDAYPQLVTSKYPVEVVKRIPGAPYENEIIHGSGWVRVSAPGREINVVTLHLSPYKGEPYRLREMPQILDQTVGASRAAAGDWVMCGDFNCYSVRDIALYEGRPQQQIHEVHDLIAARTDYVDILFEKRPNPADRCTVRGNRRIDFVYVSPSLAKEAKDAFVVRDAYTEWKPHPDDPHLVHPSDHLPVRVDFDLAPEASSGDACLDRARRELALYAAKLFAGRPPVCPVTLEIDGALGAQAYAVRVKDGRVRIAGGDGAGVLYGLYEYLENCCGVMWYAPWCEHVPRLAVWPLPEGLELDGRPGFAVRTALWNDLLANPDYAAHLRLNGPENRVRPEDGAFAGTMPAAPTVLDFTTAGPRLMPSRRAWEMPDAFRKAFDAGAEAVVAKGDAVGRHGAFAELNAWVAARCLWDPHRPAGALVREFMHGYYGKAAPYVRMYFDSLSRYAKVERAEDFPDRYLRDAAKHFEQALEAVKDDPARWWNVRRTMFQLQWVRAHKQGPARLEAIRELLDARAYVKYEDQGPLVFHSDAAKDAETVTRWKESVLAPSK